jgi:mannose-6-phosphate isomerase-like protein (cupin superfamily)
MADAYVVAEADVEGERAPGDTALVKPTIGPEQGCKLLEQRIVRYAPGRSAARRLDGRDDVLFVASGRGRLVLDGREHALEPDSGVFVAAGETAAIDNPGPGELVVVAVSAPAPPDGPGAPRRVTVTFAEQPELRADEYRTFRYLVNEDAGCREVTQFVGVVRPSRAPDHSHAYDEVGYIVEGRGLAHVDGEQFPLAAGSCFHLPPGQVHCIENTGPGLMRILGVFHPAGDPASRVYDAAPATATSSGQDTSNTTQTHKEGMA